MIDLIYKKCHEYFSMYYKYPKYLYISEKLWDDLFSQIMIEIKPNSSLDIHLNNENGQPIFMGMEIILVKRYNWCEVA